MHPLKRGLQSVQAAHQSLFRIEVFVPPRLLLLRSFPVLLHLEPRVPNQCGRQRALHPPANPVGQVMGLVDDQDDLIEGDSHRLQRHLAHTFMEQVVVVTQHDVGSASHGPRHLPRAGGARSPVLHVAARHLDQLAHVQRVLQHTHLQPG